MKDSYLLKLEELKKNYLDAQDMAKREYYRLRIIDFIDDITRDKKLDLKDADKISKRLKNISKFGLVYTYSLAENLKEQVSIVNDSIRASPIHLKKLELKNTAMIQYTDKL